MNITDILQEQARLRPDAAAITDTLRGQSRTTTFRGLEEAASARAGLLRLHGLRPGDAVLVFHPMSAELYVALLAIFRLQLIAMFLDPSAGREHIERCCTLYRPKALIASSKAHLLRLWSPALRQIPIKFCIGWPVPGAVSWKQGRAEPCNDIGSCSADTPALLTFTSGSTGQPKAAVRTHGFLLAQHRALAQSLALVPGDIDLTTLPIVVLANLASGVTSLVPNADMRFPGSIDAAPVVSQIQRHQATSSAASPAFFECLVRYCGRRHLTLPTFQKLFSGGAPVFPRLLDQMQEMAPEADVVAVYGSTEAEPIAHVSRRELSRDDLQAMLRGRGLLAGLPVKTIQLRILRDQWGKPVGSYSKEEFVHECEPADHAGEIVVSGEHVLPGYLRGLGDEETKFKVDGTIWHRTGDAGYLDHRGRVWLLGRCAARIQDEKGVLYPFAAETAVYQFPEIRRAAMVAHRGRRILALEFFEGQHERDVVSIRRGLDWTGLDDIRVFKQVPVDKRHNAKIDYPALYKLLDRSG